MKNSNSAVVTAKITIRTVFTQSVLMINRAILMVVKMCAYIYIYTQNLNPVEHLNNPEIQIVGF